MLRSSLFIFTAFEFLFVSSGVITDRVWAFQKIQGSIRRALTYLEGRVETLNRPYSMALTAYALALANSPKKHRANERLTQMAIFDPGEYQNKTTQDNSIPWMKKLTVTGRVRVCLFSFSIFT